MRSRRTIPVYPTGTPGLNRLLSITGFSASRIAHELTTHERPITKQHVQYWIRRGYVPGCWCREVHERWEIPLHDLNPHVYPEPEATT